LLNNKYLYTYINAELDKRKGEPDILIVELYKCPPIRS